MKLKTNVTRTEQKTEAIERMKMLNMHENAIREFEQEDKLNMSEYMGALYWLNEEQEELIKEFEQKNEAVVYHVIHDYTDFGELLSLLYVSKTKCEWKYDREDLKAGYTCAYVLNLDADDCSEFGGICIRPSFGGIVRLG